MAHSFISNVNYLSDLDKSFGTTASLLHNNISLVSGNTYTVTANATAYNKITNTIEPYSVSADFVKSTDVLINTFTQENISALLDTLGLALDRTITTTVGTTGSTIQFVSLACDIGTNINNYISSFSIQISLNSVVLYDIQGTVSTDKSVLSQVAQLDSYSIANINTVAADMPKVTSVADNIVPNLTEILMADTNAITATNQAAIATAEAALALSSATAAALSETHTVDVANSIKALTATAESLPVGSTATAMYDSITGAISFGIPVGATGAIGATGLTGNSIVSVVKTGTLDKVDTYTITFSDTTTATFNVTNGVGNMDTLVYDINGNGKVDVAELAESVDWANVANKPATFTPSTHTHSLDTLSDAAIVTATNGQVLSYDEATSKWINTAAPVVVTDHTLLTNIGTNTHAQIDIDLARVANTSGTNTGDQTITLTGDVTGSGTGSFVTTLADSGVLAGTYQNVVVDSKGRVTSGSGLSATDVPSLDWSKITTGAPTTVSGYGITDAYTKTEIDSFLQGLKPKESVKAATTVDIVLSGTQTIDGIALNAGDRVLVKNQTSGVDNGIYIVSANAWTRSLDADVSSELPSAYVMVEQGSTLVDTGWVCTNDTGNFTLGTTAVTFVQFSGSGTYASVAHTHDAGAIISGTLQVSRGGTGVTTSTGTGNVVLSDSPTLVTPSIGVATGASFNSITGLASTTSPMDGTAAVGTSTSVAREDHIHPTDTSREPTISTGTTGEYYRGDKTWQTLDKTAVGLGNVDNTSDANKPVSTATQTALNSKADQDVLTGAVFLGSWATIGRPTLGAGVRALGYNTDLGAFEGWNGTTWGSIGGTTTGGTTTGGGATGGGTDQVFNNNDYHITTSYTIPTGKSSVTVGDSDGNVTFDSGAVVTISSGSRWVIL